jgi:hypothetical protein
MGIAQSETELPEASQRWRLGDVYQPVSVDWATVRAKSNTHMLAYAAKNKWLLPE